MTTASSRLRLLRGVRPDAVLAFVLTESYEGMLKYGCSIVLTYGCLKYNADTLDTLDAFAARELSVLDNAKLTAHELKRRSK